MTRMAKGIIAALLILVLITGCSKDKSTNSPNTSPGVSIAAEVVAVWFSQSSNYGQNVKSDGSAIELELNGSGKIAVKAGGATYKYSKFESGSWVCKKTVGTTTTDHSGTYTLTGGKMTIEETSPTNSTILTDAEKSVVGGDPDVTLDVVGTWYSPTIHGGIDIRADGTASLLIVDGSGKLVNLPGGPTIVYSVAKNGSWEATVTYSGSSPENQTGTYTISGADVLAIYEATPDVDVLATDLVRRTLNSKVE